MGTGFYFWDDENVLELDSRDGYTTLSIPMNCILLTDVNYIQIKLVFFRIIKKANQSEKKQHN